MMCQRCGGLTVVVEYGDLFEAHEAVKCMICSHVVWVNPVPYAKPDLAEWDATEAARQWS